MPIDFHRQDPHFVLARNHLRPYMGMCLNVSSNHFLVINEAQCLTKPFHFFLI